MGDLEHRQGAECGIESTPLLNRRGFLFPIETRFRVYAENAAEVLFVGVCEFFDDRPQILVVLAEARLKSLFSTSVTRDGWPFLPAIAAVISRTSGCGSLRSRPRCDLVADANDGLLRGIDRPPSVILLLGHIGRMYCTNQAAVTFDACKFAVAIFCQSLGKVGK